MMLFCENFWTSADLSVCVSLKSALFPEGNEAFWELQCTTYLCPLQWKHRLAACGYFCTSVQVDGWL